MTSFVLYEELEKKIDDTNFNSIIPSQSDQLEWRRIGQQINQMPDEDLKAILQFIYHHYLIEKNYYNLKQEQKDEIIKQLRSISDPRKNISRYPYSVQVLNKDGTGMTFNMLKLPEKLRKIIAMFVLG